MNYEIILVFAVAVCAVILFATEKLSVDLIALLIMATLLISGIISPEEGISGFSNKATVTVASDVCSECRTFQNRRGQLSRKSHFRYFQKKLLARNDYGDVCRRFFLGVYQ